MIEENKPLIINVYGDTDSLYMSYGGLLNTIEGVENMTEREKLDIIIGINTEFLNKHNKEFMDEYYKSRHVKSYHEFELETVGRSGLYLDVKKRYAQVLLWKDGKYFDEDSLPLKVKGLEMIKSSYPKFDRESLKKVIRFILESGYSNDLWDKINIKVQQIKKEHSAAPIEDICANTGVNGYTKYILTDDEGKVTPKSNVAIIDTHGTTLWTASKCPVNVRALGNYNKLRETHNLKGDPIYGGKCKIYFYQAYKPKYDRKKDIESSIQPFAFQAKNYPKWALEYAPIDRDVMFQKYFLDPLNRICEASMHMKPFKLDGSKDISLFDMFGI